MMTDFEWLVFWAEGALFWAVRHGELARVRHCLRQLDVAAASMPVEYRDGAARFADAVMLFSARRSERESAVAHAA